MASLKIKVKRFFEKALSENQFHQLDVIFLHFVAPFSKARRERLRLEYGSFFDFKLDEITFKIKLWYHNGIVDQTIFRYQVLESGILRLIRRYLTPECVYFDIGANIGQHALYASFFSKEVYAFEPVPKLYQQFCKSIAKNNITNIRTFNFGLGKEKMELPIYSSRINMGNSTLLAKFDLPIKQMVRVEVMDDMVELKNLTRIDFMKIDVEGFEYEVLLGSEQYIKKFLPTMVIEFSPMFYNSVRPEIAQDILYFLYKYDYCIIDVGLNAEIETEFTSERCQNLISSNKQTNLLCVHKQKN